MTENIPLIAEAIHAQAHALRYACGLARSFAMAGLATELLELRCILATHLAASTSPDADDPALQPDALRPMLTRLASDLSAATERHVLLTRNLPFPSDLMVVAMPAGLRFSAIERLDQSPEEAERAVFCALCGRTVLPAETADCAASAFPLRALVVALGELIETLATAILRRQESRLAYRRQRHLSDEGNDRLQLYLRRTIEAGFMTADGEWEANITRAQIALWVDLAARRLNIARQWKWALDRWGIDHLAKDNNKNNMGRHIERRAAIERIFT